jgi:hypothetical protein
MLTLPPAVRVYVSTCPTNMHKSFDGLSALVCGVIGRDPMAGHLFVFFGRRADLVKVLYWDIRPQSLSNGPLRPTWACGTVASWSLKYRGDGVDASITGPRSTDERLRTWLDGDQLARERLCQALLALDKRFQNVQLRMPRGGPDNGRDLQARLEDGREIWIAVGFQNSVSDSRSERSQAKQKFKFDLRRALDCNPELAAFAFMTNVSLTVADKDNLLTMARTAGVSECLVFDREHLRVVLDSSEGLSVRYQYLNLALSEAEQATFFARWGTDLQHLISRSIKAVDTRLERIQFNQEKHQTLRNLIFLLEFARPLSLVDFPHVRALLLIMPPRRHAIFQMLALAVTNDDGKRQPDAPDARPALTGRLWTDSFQNSPGSFEATRPDPMTVLRSSGGYSTRFGDPTAPTIADLDECIFAIFVNAMLAKEIKRASIVANEYLLWKADCEDLQFDRHEHDIEWPWPLLDSEAQEPWIRIMPASGVGHFRFARVTPKLISAPVTADPCAKGGA